jgi:membrane fusion protein (multidrug efflux system)
MPVQHNKKEPAATETPALPWWKTRQAKTAGIITGSVAFVIIVIWAIAFRPYISTDDARVAATIVRVANRGASGLIQRVSVAEGGKVTQGEILAELDHRSAQAQYDRAKARAQFAAAERNRMESLAAQHGTSQQLLDRARSEALSADADFRLAELALEYTYLRSPVNGVVIQKTADEGNVLETNQTAITVADIEHAWVAANVEENEIARVKPGQTVKISVDEGGSLTGRVTEVRKAAASAFALIPSDNASGNFTKVVQRIPVKIVLDPHPGRTLRVGQSVVIRIRAR